MGFMLDLDVRVCGLRMCFSFEAGGLCSLLFRLYEKAIFYLFTRMGRYERIRPVRYEL